MAFNPSGAQSSALNVLGGWVCEMAPAALPEGVSPDNQDVGFLPGSVYSRPCTDKVFTPAIVPGSVCNYAKSFTTATGDIKNLYFFTNGSMYVEDWTNSPGTAALLFSSIPNSYCRSVTAFGREYIAISDGLHGTEVPLQYDGTVVERVTQGGPGAPPSVESVALASSQLSASSGNSLTRSNNIVTGVTATPHNLQVGYQVQISNIPDSNSTTVNQESSNPVITANGSYWDFNSGAYRSLFNPGTSPPQFFVASQFGLNIPSSATILGVIVSFQVESQAATTGTVNEVSLWNGALIGSPKTPATAITPTPTFPSYGSAGDSWGLSLTPAIVNSNNFGFAIGIAADSIRVFLASPFTVTVYYTLSGTGTVASISSIVINNEISPGLALITTDNPHGLAPGEDVSIVGVEPAVIAQVSAAEWSSGVTTVTTVASHNLTPGAVVQLAGVTTSTGSTSFSFNGTFTVDKVPSPNQISYFQSPITATDPDVIDATATTGQITVSWPIPDNTPTPTYFEVQSAPTLTTFYVQLSYSDGTWTTGTVGFIWEGIFYVTAIPSPTIFQYQQYGPNGGTTAIGTVTPYGQAGPGLHLCQVLFQTDQGVITAPSPFVTFIANGGQYLSISNIPIGPANTIARILVFTGAQPNVPGVIPPFFYIPVPAQLEGQVVSTATQINDNTSTTAFLDFSDNTLFAAVAISITGNNLANQIVLDGALGFAFAESRLKTWGQRNVIQNMLGLGFEGGYSPDVGPTSPLGWNVSTAGGTLVSAHFGTAWQVSIPFTEGRSGEIYQSAYLDTYGAPIFLGNQGYFGRFWAVTNGASFMVAPEVNFTLTSASTGFSSEASVALTNTTVGAFYEANFSVNLPENIPSDLIFSVFVGGTSSGGLTVTIDDIQPIFAKTPYLDTECFDSYVDNPSAFDGDSGNSGPTEDTRKIMDFGLVRGTQYCLTQDPSGRLHEIIVNPTSEPVGWTWNEVEANCGTLSAFGMTHSQADDETGSSGDNWFGWPSEGGVMIFDGGLPEKISQEIQPAWSGSQLPGVSWAQINMNAALSITAMNDPIERILFFFLPTGTATSPNLIYPLDYKELNSARAIIGSPPFHPSLGGKLVATDNTRKWTRWNLPIVGASRMYRSTTGKLTTVLYGGTFGNVYTLNSLKYTDDDFGQIDPYYVTCFHLDPDKAQAMQLSGVRIMLAYLNAFITGTGYVTYSFLINSLTNIWPLTVTRTMSQTANFDQEHAGGNAQGNRIAIKLSFAPLTGQTDIQFNLSRFQTWWRRAKLSIRGAAQ